MKIFLLNQYIWNGTILLKNIQTAFTTRELAERTLQAVKDINKNNKNDVITTSFHIEEIDFYSDEKQVPILNKDINQYK